MIVLKGCSMNLLRGKKAIQTLQVLHPILHHSIYMLFQFFFTLAERISFPHPRHCYRFQMSSQLRVQWSPCFHLDCKADAPDMPTVSQALLGSSPAGLVITNTNTDFYFFNYTYDTRRLIFIRALKRETI